MKGEIKYQNWPTKVKIATALANKKMYSTNYKIPLVVGYILLALGVFPFINALVGAGTGADTSKIILKSLSYFFLGGINIVTGNSAKWIMENSSWRERFANESSINHKIIYGLVSAIIIGVLVYVFMG